MTSDTPAICSEIKSPEIEEASKLISRPRLTLLLLTLFLAALGCAVPPALTPTPTSLSITPASTLLTATPASQTAASQPTAYIPHATLPPEPPAHRILIRHLYGLGEFYAAQSGQTFTPRGVSYQPPADQAALQDDFRRLSAAGYNTLRILIDDCAAPWGCLALPDGQGLDPVALDALVALLNQAKENNLFLLLGSAGLPEGSSYAAIASQGSSESFSGARSTALLTPQGLQAYRSYWSDLLGGLSARRAPFDIVLGWELLAEQWFEGDQPPFSLSEGRLTGANGQPYDLSDPAQTQALALDGLRYFIAELRPVILNVDPTGLVGMGFLVPDYPNPARDGRYPLHRDRLPALLQRAGFHRPAPRPRQRADPGGVRPELWAGCPPGCPRADERFFRLHLDLSHGRICRHRHPGLDRRLLQLWF